MEIEGTPYAIRFTDFKASLDYIDVLDVFNEAQFDIMLEMAATDPPQDKYIEAGRAWTSDDVYLSLGPTQDRLLHSICVLYLAATVRLWGLDSVYNFYEANIELLKTTTDWPEVIGNGHIGKVSGTAEK